MKKLDRDDKGKILPGSGGRPVGSRNKLGEAFIQDLYADWKQHGVETIRIMRAERPAEYIKVVAGTLPKEVNLADSRLKGISDEEVDNIIEWFRQEKAARADGKKETSH